MVFHLDSGVGGLTWTQGWDSSGLRDGAHLDSGMGFIWTQGWDSPGLRGGIHLDSGVRGSPGFRDGT